MNYGKELTNITSEPGDLGFEEFQEYINDYYWNPEEYGIDENSAYYHAIRKAFDDTFGGFTAMRDYLKKGYLGVQSESEKTEEINEKWSRFITEDNDFKKLIKEEIRKTLNEGANAIQKFDQLAKKYNFKEVPVREWEEEEVIILKSYDWNGNEKFQNGKNSNGAEVDIYHQKNVNPNMENFEDELEVGFGWMEGGYFYTSGNDGLHTWTEEETWREFTKEEEDDWDDGDF